MFGLVRPRARAWMSGATSSPGKIPEKELVECLTQEGGGGGDGGGGGRGGM